MLFGILGFESQNQSAQIGRHEASVFSRKLLNFTDDAIEFVDEIRMIAVLPKRGHESSVIPNGAVFFSTEPFEHFQTMSSKVSQDCARVVQLI